MCPLTDILTRYAENDQLFPDHVRTEGQKHLEEQKIEHKVHVYPGVPHGTKTASSLH